MTAVEDGRFAGAVSPPPIPLPIRGAFGFNRTARNWGRCAALCGLSDHKDVHNVGHGCLDHACLYPDDHGGPCAFPSTCRRSG